MPKTFRSQCAVGQQADSGSRVFAQEGHTSNRRVLVRAGAIQELFTLQAHCVVRSRAPAEAVEALAAVTGSALVPTGSADFTRQEAVHFCVLFDTVALPVLAWWLAAWPRCPFNAW